MFEYTRSHYVTFRKMQGVVLKITIAGVILNKFAKIKKSANLFHSIYHCGSRKLLTTSGR